MSLKPESEIRLVTKPAGKNYWQVIFLKSVVLFLLMLLSPLERRGGKRSAVDVRIR